MKNPKESWTTHLKNFHSPWRSLTILHVLAVLVLLTTGNLALLVIAVVATLYEMRKWI